MESNTGYGKDAVMVWKAIYRENCFKQGLESCTTLPIPHCKKKKNVTSLSTHFCLGALEEMCLEERVFFRLISGLHSSINAHIARNYYYNETTGTWEPNLDLFNRTLLAFPDRIHNLYFSFLFLLRCVPFFFSSISIFMSNKTRQ
jgi:hypothetical protein